jgi:hypothetical protein
MILDFVDEVNQMEQLAIADHDLLDRVMRFCHPSFNAGTLRMAGSEPRVVHAGQSSG